METVEIDVEILRRSPAAVLVTDGCGDPAWIPTGCIYNAEPDELIEGDTISIEIPSELAWEKGLV
jgi:hypothetical protein